MDLLESKPNLILGILPTVDKHMKIKILGIILKYTTVKLTCFIDFGS